MKQMLDEATRGRAISDSSLQESLQLLEQQKRIDIKRRSEIAKLEQTVEMLKSKKGTVRTTIPRDKIFFYSISEAETFCIHFYG